MELKPVIFQSIFGIDWDKLPAVFQKHYANRAYSNDRITVVGVMKIEISILFRLLSPFMRLFSTLVPEAGKNIPVTVFFESEHNSDAFCLNRLFHFPGKKTYQFRSRMVRIGQDEMIEFTKIGIGWHARYQYENHKVRLEHRGYKVQLFNKILPLPLEWFFGKAYAEEKAIDDNSFSMLMEIRHWLFGTVYSYSGIFKVSEVTLG